jgi:hypothetical protein
MGMGVERMALCSSGRLNFCKRVKRIGLFVIRNVIVALYCTGPVFAKS